MPESTHACPCGCGTQIQRSQLACRPGWFRLPADLRGWVGAAYRTRRADPDGHFRAVRTAVRWYRDHPEVSTDAQ